MNTSEKKPIFKKVWFGIAAAVGMVAVSVVTIAIKVYRQKTRLS